MEKAFLIAALTLLALASAFAQIGISTRQQLDNQFGKNITDEPNVGYYFGYGTPRTVGFDDKDVEQAILYIDFSGQGFSAEQYEQFDKESLPLGEYSFQVFPNNFLGPMPFFTDVRAWIAQPSGSSPIVVIEGKFTKDGVTSMMRLYATTEGLLLNHDGKLFSHIPKPSGTKTNTQ